MSKGSTPLSRIKFLNPRLYTNIFITEHAEEAELIFIHVYKYIALIGTKKNVTTSSYSFSIQIQQQVNISQDKKQI